MGSEEKPADGCRDDADQRGMAWAKGLRARYDKLAEEPLPDRFRELLGRLEHAEQRDR